jgi:hypothetical protein
MSEPQQIDLFDPMVIYCDDAPVVNLDQFFMLVTKDFANTFPHGTLAVSPPIPLRSGAGWYVGRAGFNFDEVTNRWWYEPYDRISDYYQTESEAADVASWHRWGAGHSSI